MKNNEVYSLILKDFHPWNSHDVKDEDDEVIGSLALARDVTDLHTSQKRLRELTSKLEQSNKHLLHL